MENISEIWTEISITVSTENIETAGNIANMVVPYGIYIEDYSALEEDAAEISHYDFIDSALLNKDRTKGIIHVYVNPHENPLEAASFITERLNCENIEHEIRIADCSAQDWVNNWKQYFHAMPIGEKLLIRPVWEQEYDAGGRTVLHIEPGLAFGTGSHPTTKLCLETLEKYINQNSNVLDIGCGSGILSIAALLLGAKSAFGVDIDKLAVKTALANAEENGFKPPVFNAVHGNLSDKVNGRYNIIVANIVADIIIQFNKEVSRFLEDGGIYITGGIINARKDEVIASFAENGFEILENYEEKDWNVFVCKRR
ncbi:MAG: 50S ribosomal protein L11 methyltransferase [Eubacterium sp.]